MKYFIVSYAHFFIQFGRSEKKHIKLPLDIEDAKQLGQVLDRYKEMYYVEVMSAVVLFYILYPFSKKKTKTLRIFLKANFTITSIIIYI